MATYIKTLKEDNGDIVYPQTITDAIYTSGGQTLETRISQYVTAEDIASSVASFGTVTTGMLDDGAVTTAKIDDGAVTSQKIDFTTINYNATPRVIGKFGALNLYEVTVGFTFSSTADTWQDLSSSDTIPTMGWVLSFTGSVYHHSSLSFIPGDASDYAFYYNETSGTIKAKHGSYFNGYSGYLTVRYTTTR